MNFEKELSRDIYIFNEINNEMAKDIVQQINDINKFDEQATEALRNYEAEPINIYINSNGGCIMSGFSIIQAMRMSETLICTIAVGSVYSMALTIFQAGHERYTSKFANFMFHGASYGMGGSVKDHKNFLKEVERMEEMIFEVFEDTLLYDEIHTILSSKEDFYFNADEAIDFLIADEFLEDSETQGAVYHYRKMLINGIDIKSMMNDVEKEKENNCPFDDCYDEETCSKWGCQAETEDEE